MSYSLFFSGMFLLLLVEKYGCNFGTVFLAKRQSSKRKWKTRDIRFVFIILGEQLSKCPLSIITSPENWEPLSRLQRNRRGGQSIRRGQGLSEIVMATAGSNWLAGWVLRQSPCCQPCLWFKRFCRGQSLRPVPTVRSCVCM